METIWHQKGFLNNTVEQYLWVAGMILAGFIFKKFISKFLSAILYRLCKKYSSGVHIDEFIALLTSPFNLLIMLVIIYLAFNRLAFPPEWNLASSEKFGVRMIIHRGFYVAVIVAVTWIFLRLTSFFGLVLMKRALRTQSRADDQLVPFIRDSVRLIIVILSFFFMLGSVFSMNVPSLIAGLGIGGLAIALAAQETLQNLLGSFVIFLDKPFTVGDLVKTGDIQGKVESIGFRSTRLRTVEKSYITVPNKKMIESGLDNLSLRTAIRATFNITASYINEAATLKNFISKVSEMFSKDERLERDAMIKINRMTDAGVELMIMFYVMTTDYDKYLVIKEEVILKILDEANNLKIIFAAPASPASPVRPA